MKTRKPHDPQVASSVQDSSEARLTEPPSEAWMLSSKPVVQARYFQFRFCGHSSTMSVTLMFNRNHLFCPRYSAVYAGWCWSRCWGLQFTKNSKLVGLWRCVTHHIFKVAVLVQRMDCMMWNCVDVSWNLVDSCQFLLIHDIWYQSFPEGPIFETHRGWWNAPEGSFDLLAVACSMP